MSLAWFARLRRNLLGSPEFQLEPSLTSPDPFCAIRLESWAKPDASCAQPSYTNVALVSHFRLDTASKGFRRQQMNVCHKNAKRNTERPIEVPLRNSHLKHLASLSILLKEGITSTGRCRKMASSTQRQRRRGDLLLFASMG